MAYIGIERLHPTSLKLGKKLTESEQQLVIRMIKGDFEQLIGISFGKFLEIYKKTLEEEPEKLI